MEVDNDAHAGEDFASAEATKGLSGRPLETFGASAPYKLDFI